MKWEETSRGLITVGPVIVSITRRGSGRSIEAKVGSEVNYLETEQDAKEWAESRMNEFKKEFILSLITKFGDDLYIFGIGVMQIVGGYDGIDRWRVYQNSEHELFEGTLEECKNYIVSCF